MKYLIFAVATLFAAEGVLAQTAAPAEPANKPVATEAAPSKPATAKDVGTKGRALQAEADRKAKRQAAMKKKRAARAGSSSTGTDAEKLPFPGSMMTDDERAAYRAKLKTFKTLDECEAYTKAHEAEMEARAKAQHKAVQAFLGSDCNRYKAAADKTAADKAAADKAAWDKAAPK